MRACNALSCGSVQAHTVMVRIAPVSPSNINGKRYKGHPQKDIKDTHKFFFSYDGMNRLIAASVHSDNPYTQSLQYDALGNITEKSTVGYYHYGSGNTGTGTAGPHAVTKAGDTTYQKTIGDRPRFGKTIGDRPRFVVAH